MKLLGCSITFPFICEAGQHNVSWADTPRGVLSAEDAVTVILFVVFCVLRSCGIQKLEGFVCVYLPLVYETTCVNAVGLLFGVSWQRKPTWISEMAAEVLVWFYDMFTNADTNPSEQLVSSLRGIEFFRMCFCMHVAMVFADPIGL